MTLLILPNDDVQIWRISFLLVETRKRIFVGGTKEEHLIYSHDFLT